MFCFFGCEACGILAPGPGIEPAPPALEGEVLTTGPPGKSLLPLCHSFRSPASTPIGGREHVGNVGGSPKRK